MTPMFLHCPPRAFPDVPSAWWGGRDLAESRELQGEPSLWRVPWPRLIGGWAPVLSTDQSGVAQVVSLHSIFIPFLKYIVCTCLHSISQYIRFDVSSFNCVSSWLNHLHQGCGRDCQKSSAARLAAVGKGWEDGRLTRGTPPSDGYFHWEYDDATYSNLRVSHFYFSKWRGPIIQKSKVAGF